jgi:hypothetical protein
VGVSRTPGWWIVTLSLAFAGAGACASSNILHEYDYQDRTIAAVSEIPAHPEVLTGPYFFGRSSGDPVRDIVRLGARVYREVESRSIRERLDSATALIDVGYALEDRTLERAARYLGAVSVTEVDEADYLLEIVVREYGIDAESWEAAAHFYIEADAVLLHADSGTEIWRAEIEESDRIAPLVFGRRSAVRDVVTATSLGNLGVEEIVEVLQGLADYSAGAITDRLREDLRDARRR